jgi:hypothetical protein
MGFTNFPHGVTSFGIPQFGGGHPLLGIGCGKIVYLVAAKATTDAYYSRLSADYGIPDDDIFTSISDAYDSLTANRNDVVVAMPGQYTVTATLAWAKSRTHLITPYNPNSRLSSSSTVPDGITRFYCATANVNNIFNVTGHFVQFYGFETMNNYDDADNVCDIKISGKNFYADSCCFRGGNGGSTQLGGACGIPVFLDSSAGSSQANMARFVNCTIGSAGNGARTVGAGAVYAPGTSGQGFDVEFINCSLQMRCETTGDATVGLVILGGNSAIDRYMLFDNCLLYNFWTNHGGKVDYAIIDGCGTTHDIILKDTPWIGIDAACNVTTHCFATSANAASDGGKGVNVDVTP